MEIGDSEERLNRMIELNTIEQCINVFKIGFVQRHQIRYGFPRIHGLVYDLKSGNLKELDVDFKSYIRTYRSIYKLHSFPSDEPLERDQLQTNLVISLSEGHEEESGRVSVRYLKRAMAKETEVFSPDEIEAAFGAALQGEKDTTTVDVHKLVQFFEK
jgi:hypothetical protein